MLESFGMTWWEALVVLGGLLIAFVIVGSSIIQSVLSSDLFGKTFSEKIFIALDIDD